MNAGKRRSRIEIEMRGPGRDDWGHESQTWIPHVSGIWANIRYLNGKSFVAAGREVSESAVSIRIGYRRGITAAMRVRHGDEVFAIKAVLPDETRRRHVDLVCAIGGVDA